MSKASRASFLGQADVFESRKRCSEEVWVLETWFSAESCGPTPRSRKDWHGQLSNVDPLSCTPRLQSGLATQQSLETQTKSVWAGMIFIIVSVGRISCPKNPGNSHHLSSVLGCQDYRMVIFCRVFMGSIGSMDSQSEIPPNFFPQGPIINMQVNMISYSYVCAYLVYVQIYSFSLCSCPSARSTFLSQAMAFEGGPAKLFEAVTVSTKPQWCVNAIPGVAQWRSMTTPPGPQWEVFKIEQGDDRSHALQNMFAYVSMFLPSVVALIFVMLFTYFHSTESTDGWLLCLSFFCFGVFSYLWRCNQPAFNTQTASDSKLPWDRDVSTVAHGLHIQHLFRSLSLAVT